MMTPAGLRGEAGPATDEAAPWPAGLPIDGFAGTIAIGGSLWGPFHRLYLRTDLQGHRHTLCTGAFTAMPLPDGALRIATTLHVLTADGADRIGISLRRAASGALLDSELIEAPGAGPATTALLAAARLGLARPGAGFLPRGHFAMGELFNLGPDGAGGLRLLCRVLGQSSYLGRGILVARCHGTQAIEDADWRGLLVADGHAGIDIATGVVLRSTIGCRIEGSAAGPRPAIEIGLQAWFTLTG